jgi:hypothetical protein
MAVESFIVQALDSRQGAVKATNGYGLLYLCYLF